MEWTMTVDGGDEFGVVSIGSANMTQGEEELAWATAVTTVVHGAYTGTHPLHCPGCASGIAVAALAFRGQPTQHRTVEERIGAATARVAFLPRNALLGGVQMLEDSAGE